MHAQKRGRPAAAWLFMPARLGKGREGRGIGLSGERGGGVGGGNITWRGGEGEEADLCHAPV